MSDGPWMRGEVAVYESGVWLHCRCECGRMVKHPERILVNKETGEVRASAACSRCGEIELKDWEWM